MKEPMVLLVGKWDFQRLPGTLGSFERGLERAVNKKRAPLVVEDIFLGC